MGGRWVREAKVYLHLKTLPGISLQCGQPCCLLIGRSANKVVLVKSAHIHIGDWSFQCLSDPQYSSDKNCQNSDKNSHQEPHLSIKLSFCFESGPILFLSCRADGETKMQATSSHKIASNLDKSQNQMKSQHETKRFCCLSNQFKLFLKICPFCLYISLAVCLMSPPI